MFDESTSLPIRAAIASFLGGLFGIGMILLTTPAQAQTAAPVSTGMSVADDSVAVIRRIGDATLRSLRGAEPVLGIGTPVTQGLRLSIDANDSGSGLRWQVARMQGLRSEGDVPRGRDLFSLGVQVRF